MAAAKIQTVKGLSVEIAFGLYCTSEGCLDFENAEKIADTLTDFLVNGVGIDIATNL